MDVPGTAPRVALRVDASAAIGTGHLRRCLALAVALVEAGAEVELLVRRLDGVAAHLLKGQPLTVNWLPAPVHEPVSPDSESASDPAGLDPQPPHQAWAGVSSTLDASQTANALARHPPDWVVVDHYAFDARWHDSVRKALGCRVAVIDDVADRSLAPDVLIDHNAHPDHHAKYTTCLVRPPATWLVGPHFALLGAAYSRAARYVFHSQVRSIGIFMGGTDPGGISAQVLQVLRREIGFSGPVEVVSTLANPHLANLRTTCDAWPDTTLTMDLPDLAEFFARHDLQLGAGGGATLERCCIGVPAMALALVDNQVPGLTALAEEQLVSMVDVRGLKAPAMSTVLTQAITQIIQNTAERWTIAENTGRIFDGVGATRVALLLCRDTLQLRPATKGDAALLHNWRNHPSIRAVSGNVNPIPFEHHVAWLEGVLSAPDRWLFVAHIGAVAVGTIRFDAPEPNRAEVSLYLAPGLGGLGLGKVLLRAGEQALRENMPTACYIDARVVPGNHASTRLFEGSGYLGQPPEFSKLIVSEPHR